MCNFYDVFAELEVFDESYGVSTITLESTIRLFINESDDLYVGVKDFLNDVFNHKISKIITLSIIFSDVELAF